jgi:hypothetical protein
MPNHPGENATVTLDDEQQALVEQIARSYAAAAPAGWLRIVSRQECSVAGDSAGIANVRVVVVETADGLEQQDYRPPRDLHRQTGDLLRGLAAASPTGVIVLLLVVDRDGSHTVTVTQDEARVLVGRRDETSSRPVHDYLERHREELTALLG